MVSPAIGIVAQLCCTHNKAEANAEYDSASILNDVVFFTDITPNPKKYSQKTASLFKKKLKEAVYLNYWSTFTPNSNVADSDGVSVPTVYFTSLLVVVGAVVAVVAGLIEPDK